MAICCNLSRHEGCERMSEGCKLQGCILDRKTVPEHPMVFWNHVGEQMSSDPKIRQICRGKEETPQKRKLDCNKVFLIRFYCKNITYYIKVHLLTFNRRYRLYSSKRFNRQQRKSRWSGFVQSQTPYKTMDSSIAISVLRWCRHTSWEHAEVWRDIDSEKPSFISRPLLLPAFYIESYSSWLRWMERCESPSW